MWKLKQKGQGLVEYALLLAIVVGIGSLLTSSFGDSISSIFGNSSNLLGTVASNAKDSSKISSDERNMKWLKDKLLNYIPEKWFQDQVSPAFGPRHNLDFSASYEEKVGGGLTDSDSNSSFMGNVDYSDLGDFSWVMSEYTKDGKQYYGVSIYDPAKNGNIKLRDQIPGTEGIITDVYEVDPNTGKISQIGSNMKQNVKSRTDSKTGYIYNVIRGNPQK